MSLDIRKDSSISKKEEFRGYIEEETAEKYDYAESLLSPKRRLTDSNALLNA